MMMMMITHTHTHKHTVATNTMLCTHVQMTHTHTHINTHTHTYQGPMSATAVEFVVRFLGYAVKAQRFGGISWRVDDVLAPILTLSTNQVLNCYTKVD